MREEILAIRLKVSPQDIYYISWNLDACEGLGILRTDDAKTGDVTIFTTTSMSRYIYDFIGALSDEGIETRIIETHEPRETDYE